MDEQHEPRSLARRARGTHTAKHSYGRGGRGPRWAWWLGGAAVTWSVVALGAMALFAGLDASPESARGGAYNVRATTAGTTVGTQRTSTTDSDRSIRRVSSEPGSAEGAR